jgi:hypothetical protein
MTTPIDTPIKSCHPTFDRLETLACRKDLADIENCPDFAELFPLRTPVETDEAYSWVDFEPGEQVPINFLTPRFAHALFEGILGSYAQLSEELCELSGGEECGYSFLEGYLPPGLYESLSVSRCDGYFCDLIDGLLQRADYLLRSLSNGVAPVAICTADEWLLHVSTWWIAADEPFFEDPPHNSLPSHEGDDLNRMSELLLEDEDLLMLWDPRFAGLAVPSHSANGSGAYMCDIPEGFDPGVTLLVSPLHPDGWFLPFRG